MQHPCSLQVGLPLRFSLLVQSLFLPSLTSLKHKNLTKTIVFWGFYTFNVLHVRYTCLPVPLPIWNHETLQNLTRNQLKKYFKFMLSCSSIFQPFCTSLGCLWRPFSGKNGVGIECSQAVALLMFFTPPGALSSRV